ncbi:MAG: PEP-CTERM sorting domain-containing protein [Rhodospirillales bacterium]|nr:PEP-CTERM sorting domain-containing protein [Rhodospirillales bacterium]
MRARQGMFAAGFVIGAVGFAPGHALGGQATVGSTGTSATEWDSSNFVFARGGGTNCVHVDARGTAAASLIDPGSAGKCTFTAGLLTITGKGATATKPTGVPAPSFINTATRGGTTAAGAATFSYVPGVILDTATYTATAKVTAPVAVGARFAGPDVAWGNAEDPTLFTSSSSTLPFGATLTSLNLTEKDGSSVFSGNYSLDSKQIFAFSVLAPSDFVSPSQIAVTYTSMLGPSFDASQLAGLLADLSIDPSSGTVGLLSPFVLFPMTSLALGPPGTMQVLAGGDVAGATAGVPEPSSLLLLLSAVGALGVLRRVRGLPGRRRRTWMGAGRCAAPAGAEHSR